MVKDLKSHSDDVEIPQSEPFKNCALGRVKYAKILTDIVSVYSKFGCVLALNGEWGSGKTTFVKMWKQDLENKNFKTLYFNAWESDYVTDPLMAMLSEFQQLNSSGDHFNKMVSDAGKIILSASSAVCKGLLQKTTGVNFDAVIDEASNIGEEILKEYSEQKSSFSGFKEELKQYVNLHANGKPIVFFVDELDRCNPGYAVKVLERMKHLFDIPQIVFVLAINKEQLGYAVQGYFGSAHMDVDEYLRRFIDIEYTLPEPDMKEYCSCLYKTYNFSDFFENWNRKNSPAFTNEKEDFLYIAVALLKENHINLRTTDKIFAHSRLALMEFSESQIVFPQIFFLLCYWKITSYSFYSKIWKHEYSLQNFVYEIENKFPKSIFEGDQSRNFIFILGSLIYFYNDNENNPLLIIGRDNKPNLRFDSRVMDKNLLIYAIHSYSRNSVMAMYPNTLENILKRIELLDNFAV